MTVLLVGGGGFFGAISRYLVDSWVVRIAGSDFPWGTLVVNLSGSFVLGLLYAASVERGILPAAIRAPVLIGFIGAYTTFSTLTFETWRLVESGNYLAAVGNIGGSVALGLIAVVTGLAIGRAIGVQA